MVTDDLIRRIPPVLRARGFRLYTQGGKRLTDLWLAGGAAVLGHTPKNVLRELKNSAERGLFAEFPHIQEKRFIKALSLIFAEKEFRIYSDNHSLYNALKQSSSSFSLDNIPVWRPFLQDDSPFAVSESLSSEIFLPILPWTLSPKVLVIPPASADKFPPSDLLSPVILSATTRSVYDLIAEKSTRGRLIFPKEEKALTESLWHRQGIYCYSEPLEDEAYSRLFLRFLDAGFLLPPSQRFPLILPGEMSQGEEATLAGLTADV